MVGFVLFLKKSSFPIFYLCFVFLDSNPKTRVVCNGIHMLVRTPTRSLGSLFEVKLLIKIWFCNQEMNVDLLKSPLRDNSDSMKSEREGGGEL